MYAASGNLILVLGLPGLLLLCAAAPVDAGGDELALVQADEARRVAAFAEVTPSVVCIFEARDRSGGGSGVVIDPAGYGLTNFHVVASLLETRRGYGGLSDGKLYPLKVIGLDPGGDIALFKLEGKERFAYAVLANSDELRAGQWVAALGNPFLLAEDYTPTITLGVVSGLHRYQYGQGNLLEYADCIQVSTSINPGNSGGPIVDMGGLVIAIAGRGSFEERGRVNVGLGYGVPVNQIKRFLPGLRAGRLCAHGTLGATVQRAGDDLIFNAIQDFSPAAKAGIELGDTLLTVNQQPVRTPNDFNNAIASLPAEWPVTLGVRRGEEAREVRTRLEPLPMRGMPTFIPDLAQNHEEIRRVLSLYAKYDLQAGQRRFGDVVWRARHEVDGVGTQEGWPDAAAEEEWTHIAAGLSGRADLDVGWQLRGGDEVDGRIVSVVERRSDAGRRVQWKFDVDSHDLLAATVGDAVADEGIVWRPGLRRSADGVRWPEVWYRQAADGAETAIRIEFVERGGAP